MTGTITDSTGGVLPGVTITAVHEATGNTFVAVTDRTNYGSWVTNEGNARYGQPTDNNNIAFMPRLMQLGFRTTF